MVFNPTLIENFEEEPYRFLSNFHEHPMLYEGKWWPTLEHAYQAMKTLDPTEREVIRQASSPAKAKRLGRRLKMRKHWDHVKTGIMLELLRIKFQIPELRDKLLQTGTAKLVEGNTWGDTYWGVCKGHGENWLGLLLMDVREEVRSELYA